MNVVLLVIFVLEIATAITRTEAIPNWSLDLQNKHNEWNFHHSEAYRSCKVGYCVKAWNCPRSAVAAICEEDSCLYKENGPWVCCLFNNANFNLWKDANSSSTETQNNFKPTTIKSLKDNDTSNANIYRNGNISGTLKPSSKIFWNTNAKEELPYVRPLGDILKNSTEKYPIYRSRNRTVVTKVPNMRVTNFKTENYKTRNILDKSRTSSSSNYNEYPNIREKLHTSTTSSNYYKRTTNLWDKPHASDSRIIFPTELITKYTISRLPTKRTSNISTKKSWSQPISTKTAWGYTTASAYTRKSVSTVTNYPYSKKPIVTTKTSTQKNQSWGSSSVLHPIRSQSLKPKSTIPSSVHSTTKTTRPSFIHSTTKTTRPSFIHSTTKTTRPSFIHSTTKTTRRNTVITPLPNVNIPLCGIRDERTTVHRQTRDASYKHSPASDSSYSGNIRLRSRFPFERIVGGEEAEPFSWPWVAALYKVTSSGGNRFLSAGSLINENFILTAAHLFTPDDLRTASYVVMLGTHDAQDAVAQYVVSSVLLHPEYEHRYYYNDIALLKLERRVIFNNYIMPVCLPSSNAPFHSDKDLLGRNVTVMGWGDDSFGGKSSQVLKQATFPIVSRLSCNASYVRVASNRFPKGITANMLCAGDPKGGKDACQGDSGGPLTVIENRRYTQVGIVSFGYKCGDKEFPGVYTKVAPYLHWIAENTKYVDDFMDYEYY